jgi:hypothetical protein
MQLRSMFACAALAIGSTLVWPNPAEARRTVVDIGATFSFDGYCSRQQAGIPGGDCEPVTLPFSVNLGGTVYDSVVVHSNGALSFGSPLEFDQFSTSLTDFSVPLFSPLFRNGEGPFDFDGDGEFVAQLEVLDSQLKVSWFSCSNSFSCFRNNFGLVLTDSADGFTVDFAYGPDGPSFNGLSGFSLPTGSFETFGALRNQTFAFGANGSLLASAVPEPATWAMMLLGFGGMGVALRRRRRARTLMQQTG